MNKINNIYVGNAPLMSPSGGGSGNNDVANYLKNAVPIAEYVASVKSNFRKDFIANNKLIYIDIVVKLSVYSGLPKVTFAYRGYIPVCFATDETQYTYDIACIDSTPSLVVRNYGSVVNLNLILNTFYSIGDQYDWDHVYLDLQTIDNGGNVTSDNTNILKCNLFVGDMPD